MNANTTIFYDDTRDYDFYDNTRDYLYEMYADEYGWCDADDVPSQMVYTEIAQQNQLDWDDIMSVLERAFDQDCYLLTGTCGRWNGPAEGGKFIHNSKDFLASIRHLDHLRLYEENGHFYVYGYHHDGSDYYELKRLTPQGYELADKNYFAHDRNLHRILMKSNLFSALPRFAERIYGKANAS